MYLTRFGRTIKKDNEFKKGDQVGLEQDAGNGQRGQGPAEGAAVRRYAMQAQKERNYGCKIAAERFRQ
jgi:hypothetical protein